MTTLYLYMALCLLHSSIMGLQEGWVLPAPYHTNTQALAPAPAPESIPTPRISTLLQALQQQSNLVGSGKQGKSVPCGTGRMIDQSSSIWCGVQVSHLSSTTDISLKTGCPGRPISHAVRTRMVLLKKNTERKTYKNQMDCVHILAEKADQMIAQL